MTQLVQLQQTLRKVRDEGYEIFAISNDTVDRLAEFSDRHGIEFSLLSDEDSEVIRAFGILNTLIQPGEGKHMRWYGIPYPGTYVTDSKGIVIDKDFHQHHARRLSGQALLHRVLGTVPDQTAAAPATTFEGDEVSLTAYLADPVLSLEVITSLVCRLRIAPGLHIYAAGAPEAFTPVSLSLSGEGVRFGEPTWPKPGVLRMADLEMAIPVYEQEVTVTVPITATSEIMRLGHGLDRESVEITVVCRYQACDDVACGLPTAIETKLVLPLQTLVEPEGIKTYVERLE
jgi:alkyl hydroperoxide reductase subunit AhpC